MANRHAPLLVSILTVASLAGCVLDAPADGAGPPASTTATTPSPSASTTRPPARPVDPVALASWAGKYCAAVAPLDARIEEFEALLAVSTVDDLVDTAATAIEGMYSAYNEAAMAAARAGIPPIEGGLEIFDAVASLLLYTRQVYGDLAQQLASGAADDVNDILAVLEDAQPQLRVERRALAAALDRPEMDIALDAAPECTTTTAERWS